MKKILAIFLCAYILVVHVNAVPVSIYMGSSNSFCFPVIRADSLSALTTFGFAGMSEIGVDVRGWQFGTLFSASLWGEGKGEEALMKNFISIQLGAIVSKEFDSAIIPFFPDWFGFHPSFSVRYGVFHTEHYRSSAAKIFGSFNNEWDQVLFLNAGLFVDFYPGNYVTLFVGGDVIGWYDEDTVVFSPAVSTGVKIHPNRKKYLEEKKQSYRQKKAVRESEATLTIEDDYFDNEDDFVHFNLSAVFPKNVKCKSWKLEIFDSNNKLFFDTFADGDIVPVLKWDAIGNNLQFVDFDSKYYCKFSVVDSTGHTSIDSKILFTSFPVEYQGKNIKKIEVSSIIFSANRSSLDEVSPKQKIKNKKVLDNIARFIKKSSYHNVHIIGHANNVRRREEDEETLWIPLSKARIEEIRRALIKRGIDSSKITIEAKGGRFPVSTNQYQVWRNRRVEIIVETVEEGTNE